MILDRIIMAAEIPKTETLGDFFVLKRTSYSYKHTTAKKKKMRVSRVAMV